MAGIPKYKSGPKKQLGMKISLETEEWVKHLGGSGVLSDILHKLATGVWTINTEKQSKEHLELTIQAELKRLNEEKAVIAHREKELLEQLKLLGGSDDPI